MTTRREFLAGTAGVISLALHKNCLARVPPGIRKSAGSLTPSEWATFERGVAAMKQLPTSTPVSWRFQANIHGYPPNEPGPFFQGWKTCQHGNWWFLPWHRAYLLYFERILQAQCGDPSFRLPYWDWTDPNQLSLPERFLDRRSPLFEGSRAPEINAGSPIDPSAVSWPSAARQTIFSTPTKGQGFGSEREEAPGRSGSHGAVEAFCHDLVHDAIGGLMGDPDTAARDPIFWLHHANVDRLWGAWLRKWGGAYLPYETRWRDASFLFYGPRGRGGYVTAGQMLSSVALGYQYDEYPPVGKVGLLAGASHGANVQQLPASPQRPPVTPPTPVIVNAREEKKSTIAALALPRKELTSEPISVNFALNSEAKRRMESVGRPSVQAAPPAPGQPAAAPVRGPSLQVVIDDIRFDKSPGRFYEVYINLPQLEDAKGPESVYYVGSISFFALSTHHEQVGHAGDGAAGKSAVIDATETIARLRALGRLGEGLKVTLIERSTVKKRAVGALPGAATRPKVTIEAIRFQHSGE